jgi:hypothetical protein
MTMPASPNTLNMAGTSSPVSVAYELGLGLTTTISMNDAAVRTLAGVSGSGTTWSMSSLWGKSNITINNAISSTAQASDFAPISAYLYFNSNGSIGYFDPAISYGSTNWATPTTAGIGNNYWIRVTRVSGITPSGMTSGTIYALSGSPYMFVTAVFDGQVRISTGTIDIYSDAGGVTRVGGGTYALNAEAQI